MFFKLVKNEFMSLLTMNNMFDLKKGKIKKPLAVFTGAALFAVLILYMSTMYSYMLATSLIPYNAVDVLPAALFVAGCIAVFFYGALKSNGVLFSGSDFDLLMSMPIESKTVIGAKLAFLYLSDLFFALAVTLLCLGVWAYFTSPPLINIVLSVLALPFMTVIPLVLSTVVGSLVAYISGFFKKKAFITIAANLIFVLGIMYLSFSMGSLSSTSSIADIAVAYKNQLFGQYPPARLFYNITCGSFYDFVVFALISLLLLAVYVAVISKYFVKIHSMLESSQTVKKSTKLTLKASSAFGALVKKEASLFLATPSYFINMGLGYIMCILAAAWLIFFGKGYVLLLTDIPQAYDAILLNIPFALIFMICLTPTTAVTISLEGSNLWQAKSLPVKAYDLFMSKVAFNLYLAVPSAIIICAAVIIRLQMSLVQSLSLIIMGVSCCVFASFMGLAINLKFHNFQWTNPTRIVKQSTPVFITVFGAMGMCGIGFLAANSFGQISPVMLYCIFSMAFLAISLIINSAVKAKAENLLKAL